MNPSGSRVLVTGADGFIGSHLVEALVEAGAHVTALALYNSFDTFGWLDDLPEEVRERVDMRRGDVRDASFMQELMDCQNVVFHLAALIAIPQSYVMASTYVQTNLLGTLNLLEAARRVPVGRIVHTSTSEVYGTALKLPIDEHHPLQGQSPYSASKIGADVMTEAFYRSFELPVAILRPFNTFGPRQSERAIIPTVIRQALDKKCNSIVVGDTSVVRDMTFVKDTVNAFMALGFSDGVEYGRPYNAGSGCPVTIAELIELIQDAAGCTKPVRHDPARFRPAASEVRALLADSTRLTDATGWRPGISLREGIADTVAWWRRRFELGRVRAEASYMT